MAMHNDIVRDSHGPAARRTSRHRETTPMMKACYLAGLVGVAAMSAMLADAVAFDPKAVLQQTGVRAGVAAPAPRPKVAEVNPQTLFLVRSTLSALNDANRTGNYTVLRDLAAPSFQAAHSPADLAQIFADLRRNQIDLAAAALIAPRINPTPAAEKGQPLQLAGHLATEPRRIVFDLRFEAIGGHWRLSGLSVGTTEIPAKAVAAAKSTEQQ